MARPPLAGATVLVTGASAGIGTELARAVAPRAGTLVLVARRRERLDALRAELLGKHPNLSVVVVPADLGDPGAVDGVVRTVEAEAGPIDVLVNNAGLGDIALFEATEWAKLEQMIRVNVLALTLLTHRLLPGMLARKKGGVLNVSSGLGLVTMPGTATYSATKHYVTAFTEALRLELRGTGVVVSQACPGPVATEFESVAGNPTGQAVPGWLNQPAEACARQILDGFARGRGLILPGLPARWLIRMGAATPRWVLRLVFGGIGSFLRRRLPAPAQASATGRAAVLASGDENPGNT